MIEDLKRILTIIAEGSVTRASQKLYVTQPALTHAIRRVEKQLGIQIFRHLGKKLVLTQQGQEAMVGMERIVKLWEGMVQKSSFLTKETCTIGVYDNAASLLSPVFKKYYDKDDFMLEVIIDNSETLFSQLVYGIVDICVCIADKTKSTPARAKLVATYSEELIPVASKTLRIQPNQMPFILYNRDSLTRKYIDTAFISHGIQPRVIVESTSPQFIKELALAGSGVAILPKNFIRMELENGSLRSVPLSMRFQRTVNVYKNNESGFSAIDALIGEIWSQLKVS